MLIKILLSIGLVFVMLNINYYRTHHKKPTNKYESIGNVVGLLAEVGTLISSITYIWMH